MVLVHQHISIWWQYHSSGQETIHLDHIVINRGGMCFGITTRDCGPATAYQYLGWWPTAVPAMAPTEQLHSLRRGGDPPIGPRAPRRMYGRVHVPLASNHSNSCQRVLLPISILNRKLSGSAVTRLDHHHVYLLSNDGLFLVT